MASIDRPMACRNLNRLVPDKATKVVSVKDRILLPMKTSRYFVRPIQPGSARPAMASMFNRSQQLEVAR